MIYSARVRLAQTSIAVENKQDKLSLGMSVSVENKQSKLSLVMAVSVEIKTGHRRVLEYF